MRWRWRWRALSLVALTGPLGCNLGLFGVAAFAPTAPGPYLPETLANELGLESVRTIGCVDVGLSVDTTTRGDFVDVHLGNRCTRPEKIDLRRLAVLGGTESGHDRDVALSDPKSELVPLHIAGSTRGRERFFLSGSGGTSGLCFDLTRIAPEVPAAHPAPLCFERRDARWVAKGGS